MQDDDAVLHVLPGTNRAAVSDPARALRAATAVRAVLEELRGVEVDEGVHDRLGELLTGMRSEISGLVSDDLAEEVTSLDLPDPASASSGELRLALAQLLGWVEGLFHGVSAELIDTDEDLGTGRSGHYL